MSGTPLVVSGATADAVQQKFLFNSFTNGLVFKNTGANPIKLSFGLAGAVTSHAHMASGGFTVPAEELTIAAGDMFPYDGSFADIITSEFYVTGDGGASTFDCTGLV